MGAAGPRGDGPHGPRGAQESGRLHPGFPREGGRITMSKRRRNPTGRTRPAMQPARPMTPSCLVEPAPEVVEVPPRPHNMAMIQPGVNSYLRAYRVGPCSVLVTREYGLWHLSIAHPSRLPTWLEITTARYALVP